MPSEKIEFASPRHHMLSGSLEMPSGLLRGVALFAHCFTCTKQSKAAVRVSRLLAREGIACLRFDFTGLGGSDGEFGAAGFTTDVEDLVAAAEHLTDRFGMDLLLVGHSLGGAAVLCAAGRMDCVAAVATIGAPSDIPHVLKKIEGDLGAIEEHGEGEVKIAGRAFSISRQFIDATRNADLLAQVSNLRIPLMFLHSPTDQIVGIEHAAQLFKAAIHPKSFVSLDGADHLLVRQQDAEFAARMIAGWACRYLPEPDIPEELDTGVLIRTGSGKFGTEVHTASHRFVADEPSTYGGEDAGPTPYDLLLAALGTCTAMTIKMYAERKDIPFSGTTIRLRHERDHAEDAGHSIDAETKIQALYRDIELHGSLNDDDRAKLMDIADKCPVHRTLEGHLHIHTSQVG